MNLILVICHCKRSASEIRSFDLNRQQGKSFFDNCVDHTLVVCDSVVNDLIQIIIVFDVYLIKVVSIFIRSDFLNGRERAEAGKIIDTEASDKEKDDTDNHKGDSFYMFFHRASSLSSNLVILSDQTVRTAMQALHLSLSAPGQAYRSPPQKR